MAMDTGEQSAITGVRTGCSYHTADGEADCNLILSGKDNKIEQKPVGAFDTKAKKLIIVSISVYSFIMSSAYSMLAPFFPGEVILNLFMFHFILIFSCDREFLFNCTTDACYF